MIGVNDSVIARVIDHGLSRGNEKPQVSTITAPITPYHARHTAAPSPPIRGEGRVREAPTLRKWLDVIRAEGWRIRLVNGELQLVTAGGATAFGWEHQQVLARHRHALQVAAAGTHPRWWDHVSGREPAQLTVDDLPTAGDPTNPAFACTACGAPATTVTGEPLAWCPEHA